MEIETRANYQTILESVQKRSPPDFIIFNHDVKYYCHFNVIAMSSKKLHQCDQVHSIRRQ